MFLDPAYFLKRTCLWSLAKDLKGPITALFVVCDLKSKLKTGAVRYCPTKTNCVPVEFDAFGHCPTRHGDVVFQVISSFVAQSEDLFVWQDVQGFGILYLSVIAGEMNLKVCELTKVPGTP
jgi:hypothetical protein